MIEFSTSNLARPVILRQMSWILFVIMVLSLAPQDGLAAISVYQLNEKPVLNKLDAGKQPSSFQFSLTLVKGEAEGNILHINCSQKELAIEYNSSIAEGMHVDIYRVGFVGNPGASKVGDPIIPLSSGVYFGNEPGGSFLYVKLSANEKAKSGSAEFSIKVKTHSEEKIIKYTYEVLPFTIIAESIPTIQATVRPMFSAYPKPVTSEQRLQILKNITRMLAGGYYVRSFAGLGGSGKKDLTMDWNTDKTAYLELIRYCLDELGVHDIRLPPQHLFSKRNPFSALYKDPTEEAVFADLVRYRKNLEFLVNNPKWKGKFSMRLWDEPRPADYPAVVMTYKAARRAFPEFSLELTEQPDERLGDIAQVWVVNPRHFDASQTLRQSSKGGKVWLYCNKAAGIDEPLKGMQLMGWLLWRYRLDGYMFFSVNFWSPNPWLASDRLWKGTFIYPNFDNNEVFPSLRLEYFREGIEDCAILKQLEAPVGAAADSKTKAILESIRGKIRIAEKYGDAQDPRNYRTLLLDRIRELSR